MMLIDYPHSKNIHKVEIYGIQKLKKIKSLLNKISKFQKFFTTCKWGEMYMMSKTNLYFMIQEKKS
jgi:hypothetical protein